MDITPRGVKKDEEMDESLILIHQNIRGLPSKINEFTSMLTLEQINLRLYVFSKHHMTESNLGLHNISNYNLSMGFCRQTYQNGGVCVYVREDICYKTFDLTRYCEEKIHEVCATQIRSTTNLQIIICMYKSPSGNFYQFLKLLDIMLMFLYQPKTEFTICEDINIDYLSDGSKKRQLSQLLGSYNISHLVNFPTRFQRNHISAIDNIFVNNAQLQQSNILPIHNGLSDHDAQCLLLKNLFIKKKKLSGKYKTRLFTTDTIGHFQKLLLEETWARVYQEHDVRSIFNKFLRIYLNIFEASFPIAYFNKHNDNAWITKGIRISCKK